MNLTYIQQKVNKMEYKTLKEFFADVDLMITNALLYNSDPSNPYRIAAEDMKKRYLKMAKKVLQTLQQSKNRPSS
jgi:Bromodomain